MKTRDGTGGMAVSFVAMTSATHCNPKRSVLEQDSTPTGRYLIKFLRPVEYVMYRLQFWFSSVRPSSWDQVQVLY